MCWRSAGWDVNFFKKFFFAVSTYSVAMISFQRFVAVTQLPSRACHNQPQKPKYVLIATVWGIGFIVSVPHFITAQILKDNCWASSLVNDCRPHHGLCGTAAHYCGLFWINCLQNTKKCSQNTWGNDRTTAVETKSHGVFNRSVRTYGSFRRNLYARFLVSFPTICVSYWYVLPGVQFG